MTDIMPQNASWEKKIGLDLWVRFLRQIIAFEVKYNMFTCVVRFQVINCQVYDQATPAVDIQTLMVIFLIEHRIERVYCYIIHNI